MNRVLVVDDDACNRELLTEILRAERLDVLTAANGNECLERVRQDHPDLLLLDVNMPFVNGFEVCRFLKQDPSTRLTPIILLTALSALEDRVIGLKAGADDFLTKPVDSSELLARVHSLLSLKRYTDELERAETVLFALARSIEAKDPHTQGHCERLATTAEALARRMNLPEDQIIALRRAGVIHDIGKVAVPDSILLKPSALTDDERNVMQQHPVVGEKICKPLHSLHLVLPIIRHHHEKMDGSGYPDGLEGDAIPLTARILQVVDVFDALTSRRPYKRALSTAEALATMNSEVQRGWWDPQVFQEFRKSVSPPIEMKRSAFRKERSA